MESFGVGFELLPGALEFRSECSVHDCLSSADEWNIGIEGVS